MGIEWIGIVAGIITTASLFPQVAQVVRTKLTRDISLGWAAALTIGMTLWLIYGIAKQDLPLIVANVTAVPLSATVLVYKIRFK